MGMITRTFSFIFLSVVLWGCSNGNGDSPMFDPVTGNHPANWIELHFVEFRNDSQKCVECHGSATDPDQSGGISKVSCFSASRGAQTCHANGPSGHPAGYGAAAEHGRLGAMAAPGPISGFAYCSRCHGSQYNNGTARSCFDCHTNAPHPDAPWHGTTASGTNHVFTAEGNAPECAKCHTNGANSSLKPTTPAPAGTPPGCFNNTLCHGNNVGHPAGWGAPTAHGARAKAASSPSGGFGYCQSCHGTDYQGGTAGVSCFGCHPNSPHSPAPWLGGPRTHVNTDTSNALFCASCHRNPQAPAGTAAGCFNNTLCHGSSVPPPHPVGGLYLPAAQHGADAINKNNNGTGLTSCQPCHANPNSGANPRFNVPRGATLTAGCETCHKAQTAHPTPWLIGRGTTLGSTNSLSHSAVKDIPSPGNTVTNYCTLCHGASLSGLGGVAPSCSSGSSRLTIPGVASVCHFNAVAVKDPVTGLFNLQTGCVSCHGNPPTGTTYPNRDGQHTEHLFTNVTCASCHNGAGYRSALHANGTANLSIQAAFQAKSGGAPGYNASAGSCSNISCHGGQTTPRWNDGIINVSTSCSSCHIFGTTQFNSYFSGRHQLHLSSEGLSCTDCHDTTRLATQHFTGLNTPSFTNPAATLKSTLGFTGSTCNPSAGGLSGCHGSESW
jgi:predicted CxxxxCH...CXXCH cytochrome family protein